MQDARASAVAARWLTKQFTAPGAAFPGIVARVASAPERVDWLIAGVSSPDPRIKFGSAKALRLVAFAEPRLVYPRFDFFVRQLDSPNGILRWNAASTLAFLAPADRQNRIETIPEKYLSAIDGPELIGAANAIQGAAVIACAKPRLAARIVPAILRVERARYKTEECRKIAIGHAIQALGEMIHSVPDCAPVVSFVQAQLTCSRSATRKKAEAFLRRHADACGTSRPTTRRRPSA